MAIDQREALIAAVRAQVEKEKAAKAAKLKKEQEAMQLSGGTEAISETGHNKPKYKTLTAEELAKIEEKKRRKRAAELGIKLEEDEPQDKPAENAKPEETKPVETAKETTNKKAADNTKKSSNTDKKEEGLGMSVGIQADKSGKSLDKPAGGGLNAPIGGGLSGNTGSAGLGLNGEKKEKSAGLGLNLNLNGSKEEKKTSDKKLDTKDTKPQMDKKKQEAEAAQKAKLQPTKVSGGNSSVKIIGGEETADDPSIKK